MAHFGSRSFGNQLKQMQPNATEMGSAGDESFKRRTVQAQRPAVTAAQDSHRQVAKPEVEAEISQCRWQMEHACQGSRSKIQVYGSVSCSSEVASIDTESQPPEYDPAHPGDGHRSGCL